ncbi:MAG: hypothetical protein PHQ76_02935 [Caldisericia bacterium]|nr:hypothetical protein [Caldisericia bacterium]
MCRNYCIINKNNASYCRRCLAVDYDKNGKIAGLEALNAIKRFGNRDVFKKVILEDIALHS